MGSWESASEKMPVCIEDNLSKKNAWDRLPFYTIERILAELNPRDRSRASTVCKSWADAYDSPNLWKRPLFKFNKMEHHNPKFNPRHVVNKYGRFFKKLTIMYKRPKCNSLKFISRQICDLLQAMTEEGVQLESIRMCRLMIIGEIAPVRYSCLKMVEFLRKQTALNHIDFSHGRVYNTPGMEVLESLVAENVHHLILQNYFDTEFSYISRNERFYNLMGRFSALRTLSLNYNYLSDKVMEYLARNSDGHLEEFSILCKSCHNLDQAISNQSWICLRRKCPLMKVRFILDNSSVRTSRMLNSNIMSTEMPLVWFEYNLRKTWKEEQDQALFNFLAGNFAQTLRQLKFDIQGRDNLDIRTGIADVVGSCTMLEEFILRARFPDFEMGNLFDRLWDALSVQLNENGTVSLKIIRATFRGLPPNLRNTKDHLKEMYVPKFNDIGIVLKLKMKD